MKGPSASTHRALFAAATGCAAAMLVSCGGGGGGGGTSVTGSPPPAAAPPAYSGTVTPLQITASLAGNTDFQFPGTSCYTGPASGVPVYGDQVEPQLAVDPTGTGRIVAVWQQDRIADAAGDGGALGLFSGLSVDGGATWSISSLQALPFTYCSTFNWPQGFSLAFERASDPWVSFGPGGDVYAGGLAFTTATNTTNGVTAGSAIVVSKLAAADLRTGTANWRAPAAVVNTPVATAFNDKPSLSADGSNANYVYMVWDQLDLNTTNHGTVWWSRSADAGATWGTAHAIFDPGANVTAIGNVILVDPVAARKGTLYDLYTAVDAAGNAHLGVIRSPDNGTTWSAETQIATIHPVDVTDPATGRSPQLQLRTGNQIASFAIHPTNGTLYAAWMDATPSGGARDAILVSQSTDQGAHWSTPVVVNEDRSVAAFTPAITVRADGAVGVGYYDFHDASNTDTAKLATDYWVSYASSNLVFAAAPVGGAFDAATMNQANIGLFMGDYEGLAADATDFLSVAVRTVPATTSPNNNPHGGSVYFSRIANAKIAAAAGAAVTARAAGAASTADSAALPAVTPQLQARSAAFVRALNAQRLQRWNAARGG